MSNITVFDKLWALVTLVAFYGWVKNALIFVLDITCLDFNLVFFLRLVGLVLFPLGGVMGFISNPSC